MIFRMTLLPLLAAILGASAVFPPSKDGDACRYMKSRTGLTGYDSSGPYILDHFRLTKGRTDLPDFPWNHWGESPISHRLTFDHRPPRTRCTAIVMRRSPGAVNAPSALLPLFPRGFFAQLANDLQTTICGIRVS